MFYVKGAKKYFVVLFLGVGIYLGHLDADLTIVYVRYMEWFVIYVQFSKFRKEKTPIFVIGVFSANWLIKLKERYFYSFIFNNHLYDHAHHVLYNAYACNRNDYNQVNL